VHYLHLFCSSSGRYFSSLSFLVFSKVFYFPFQYLYFSIRPIDVFDCVVCEDCSVAHVCTGVYNVLLWLRGFHILGGLVDALLGRGSVSE